MISDQLENPDISDRYFVGIKPVLPFGQPTEKKSFGEMDIKTHAVTGTFWNVFFALANKVFTLVGQLALNWFLLPDGQGGAEWIFEPQGDEKELNVEYRVLLSEFTRVSFETAAELGKSKETLELPSVVGFPQVRVSGHHLRKKHKTERA